MRKLMEAVGQINESWDPKGLASVIYDEIRDVGSPVRKAFDDSNEPYRASIYKYGELSSLYNPESLDGSALYHEIVDELELLVAGVDERFMGEAVEQLNEDPTVGGNMRDLSVKLVEIERYCEELYWNYEPQPDLDEYRAMVEKINMTCQQLRKELFELR